MQLQCSFFVEGRGGPVPEKARTRGEGVMADFRKPSLGQAAAATQS